MSEDSCCSDENCPGPYFHDYESSTPDTNYEISVFDKCPWYNCRRMRYDYKCTNRGCYDNRPSKYNYMSFTEWEKEVTPKIKKIAEEAEKLKD